MERVDLSAAYPRDSGEFHTLTQGTFFNPKYFEAKLKKPRKGWSSCLFRKYRLRWRFGLDRGSRHLDRHQNCKSLKIKDLKGMAERVGFDPANLRNSQC
jgi:hypothetical protein